METLLDGQTLAAGGERDGKEGEPPQHIAIVRALPGLGDFLCVVPALRALRSGLPEAYITWIGLPAARALVDRFSMYLDDFLEFPGYPGILEKSPVIAELPAFFASVQGRFDLALQMHGSGIISNIFTMMLGAPINAGFYLPGHYCPDEARFLPYVEEEPEVRRYLRLMAVLGLPSQGEALEFPLTPDDRQAVRVLWQAAGLQPGGYICIHPGAQDAARRWPPGQFALVADALARHGLQIVLTGTAAEKALTRAVSRSMKAPAVDLAGQTSLGALAALLDGARLLVCNDTGVSHLAAALQVPSVVIFLAPGAGRWGPLDRRLHRVLDYWGKGHGSERATERIVLAEAEALLQRDWPEGEDAYVVS